jgi:hypothetical protein
MSVAADWRADPGDRAALAADGALVDIPSPKTSSPASCGRPIFVLLKKEIGSPAFAGGDEFY